MVIKGPIMCTLMTPWLNLPDMLRKELSSLSSKKYLKVWQCLHWYDITEDKKKKKTLGLWWYPKSFGAVGLKKAFTLNLCICSVNFHASCKKKSSKISNIHRNLVLFLILQLCITMSKSYLIFQTAFNYSMMLHKIGLYIYLQQYISIYANVVCFNEQL